METNGIAVKSCTKTKDVTWNGKTVPSYKVELSDGRFGESFGTLIPEGTPVSDLDIQEGQYGLKIKLNKPKNGFAGMAKQRAGNASYCLAYAKDLVVAGKVELKDIWALADKMYVWMEGKKK